MVKEYIERETSLIRIKRLMKQIAPIEENRDMFFHDSGINGAITGALLEVENIPAADVVEVVRCKDCGFCTETYDNGDCWCSHDEHLQWFNVNHFCGYGKRKSYEAD